MCAILTGCNKQENHQKVHVLQVAKQCAILSHILQFHLVIPNKDMVIRGMYLMIYNSMHFTEMVHLHIGLQVCRSLECITH